MVQILDLSITPGVLGHLGHMLMLVLFLGSSPAQRGGGKSSPSLSGCRGEPGNETMFTHSTFVPSWTSLVPDSPCKYAVLGQPMCKVLY